MSKIPIEIEKIKKVYRRSFGNDDTEYETTEYQITIAEKGQAWQKTYRCGLNGLRELRDKISDLIESTTIAEKLHISNNKGKVLEKHYNSDELCQKCLYKESQHCLTCIFELQSPLERKLFVALHKKYIRFDTQYPLNWKGEHIFISGKSYDNPLNNFKDVLTVVDFYIEKRGVRLCVYTDGHTYHERTEEQAQRDKRIDRKLQELGFHVLRYTGKEVNENIDQIVAEIEQWIKNPNYRNM